MLKSAFSNRINPALKCNRQRWLSRDSNQLYLKLVDNVRMQGVKSDSLFCTQVAKTEL